MAPPATAAPTTRLAIFLFMEPLSDGVLSEDVRVRDFR
jgi:hypothetical protein